MRANFLPFSRPSIGEPEFEEVAEVLRSGWITTGPKAAEFEAAFRGGRCGHGTAPATGFRKRNPAG